MTTVSCPRVARVNSNKLLGFLFAFMLIFLQEGYSYYLSFQTLALLLVLGVLVMSRPSIYSKQPTLYLLISLAAFCLFLGITGMFSASVVSRNTINIFLTIGVIWIYALLIVGFLCVSPRRVIPILIVFRTAAAVTTLTLTSLIMLTELSLIPGISRNELLLQNSRLITNATSEDALISHLAAFNTGRLDLFYGEPSYLGVVLFTCVSSFILTSKLISNTAIADDGRAVVQPRDFFNWVVISGGVFSMFYIESLSAIIFGLLIVMLQFGRYVIKKFSVLKITIFIFVVLAFGLSQSFDYAVTRISNTDSMSFYQRFGFLSNFQMLDFLTGLQEESRMPEAGFHNGLFYIFAVSGVGGIWLVYALLRAVYVVAKPLGMSTILTLVLLALMMQNGAVFSPNKVVLFALILLPLSCARVLFNKRNNATEKVVS